MPIYVEPAECTRAGEDLRSKRAAGSKAEAQQLHTRNNDGCRVSDLIPGGPG